MKKRLLLASSTIIVTMLSCKPDAKTDINPLEKLETEAASAEEIATEAAKLKGVWLSDQFLSGIEKSKSIYNVKRNDILFGFWIEQDKIDSKKLFINTFSGNEGEETGVLAYDATKQHYVHISTGEEFNGLKNTFDVASVNENVLELQLTSGKKQRYQKITDIDDAIRQQLFAGNYTDEEGNTVTFKSDGNVTGIPDKGFYILLYTFDVYEFDTLDISLNDKQENFERYHFKFEGNTLSLYTILEDENQKHSIGPLLYTFVKK